MSATESPVRLERVDNVAVLTIDRPKALNALDAATLRALDLAIDDVGDARALVLTGGGEKAFVAGADIAAMQKLTSAEATHFAAMGQRVFGKLEALPMPVIAAVNGFALGGGCELALACDLILAAPNAVFGQPEVKIGVIPGFGGTQRLVRRVGSMRARELIFTGRNVKAEEAAQIGLALKVVTEGTVKDAAIALAKQIAAQGPVAVRLAKRAILDGDGAELRVGLAGEATLFGMCFATDDQKEGMAAFLEKRPAAFKGS
ncbi:MAG: enoyl-CoA hydratase-related protein [Myxococcota bacterium]